jgi:low affinity Fe/Cu permease
MQQFKEKYYCQLGMCDFLCDCVYMFRIILLKILVFMISYSVYLTWQIYICMPINITLLLGKTEGAIRNGQFRDTENIRHTRERMTNYRHYTEKKTTIQRES